MIFVLLLTVIAVALFLFLLVTQLTVWKKHLALQKKYLIRKEKSELVYLVGLGKIKATDELFEKTYLTLNSFEQVCGKFSFRHIITIMENDKDFFRKQDVVRISDLLKSSTEDVQKVIRHSYETIGRIILRNSHTTSFFFFLVRKTFVKILFEKFPQFILDSLKRLFRNQWETISTLIYFEDKMNLRLI